MAEKLCKIDVEFDAKPRNIVKFFSLAEKSGKTDTQQFFTSIFPQKSCGKIAGIGFPPPLDGGSLKEEGRGGQGKKKSGTSYCKMRLCSFVCEGERERERKHSSLVPAGLTFTYQEVKKTSWGGMAHAGVVLTRVF